MCEPVLPSFIISRCDQISWSRFARICSDYRGSGSNRKDAARAGLNSIRAIGEFLGANSLDVYSKQRMLPVDEHFDYHDDIRPDAKSGDGLERKTDIRRRQ